MNQQRASIASLVFVSGRFRPAFWDLADDRVWNSIYDRGFFGTCHLYYYLADFTLSLTPVSLPILAPALTAPFMLYFCLRVIVRLDDAAKRMKA